MRLGKCKLKTAFLFAFALAFHYLCTRKVAQMVESVDTRDLKSLGHIGCTGSSPVPGTNEKNS